MPNNLCHNNQYELTIIKHHSRWVGTPWIVPQNAICPQLSSEFTPPETPGLHDVKVGAVVARAQLKSLRSKLLGAGGQGYRHH